ncbi:coiled-coil-helix-coiled-coil-helix domain-containing protein 5 isoform X2 [Aplysia californica]|nr:coiled-coil-helix-coiled-coil-helix domain-containing protein 5 isoform X2 [Aplysia californica]
MKLVETHCSKYLDMFGECIKQYPHTWQMDCEPERRKLAKCAETNPEIVHIKTVCGDEFHEYEKCMIENRADTEKCAELFTTFSDCADAAVGAFTATASNPATVSKASPSTGSSSASSNER